MENGQNYLDSAIQQFEYYKSLGEKTFKQLNDEHLFWQYNSDANSIAVIVQHIHGNMLSRWTNFLTTDGEKPNRNRDTEFEHVIKNRQELMAKWNEGWQCVFDALNQLTPADLNKIVYIRAQAHTVIDAINRQLAHYPYHIGQIVHIGKMCCDDHWKSLTIPKGQSAAFNADMFKS